MVSHLPPDHPQIPPKKIGVLLLNLGTPDATDYWSMRRYLKEFLSDRRVIEIPRAIWWPILNLIVLTTRPKKSGAAYDKIWDMENDDSPLRVIAKEQVEKLSERLKGQDNIVVDYGMRYGNPSTPDAIDRLKAQGCEKILLVPLYPQYAASTTATANDKAFDHLKTMRWQPAVRTAPAYFEDPAYIEAIANSITDGLEKLDFKPDLVITSYHGVPKSYLMKGDPYHCQCFKTTRLVREKLGWAEDKMMVTFQSRFGPEEWLQPYTDKTLEELPSLGVKKVAILTPGFSVDCLETLEEIAMEGEEEFMEAGGEKYAYIPCLNATDPGMDVIESVVRRELQGWL
ncbi:ferrochelatase [Maritalea mediterranea]|uniref:Ferrochelatase n=1 Tax=Maritalea mediterranea TaxID=2909667 RepID=A0ABS9E9P2_9HYPH|nr:ferrochelatase [Maritalea mediterranea]MCF4099578.1 ferrochelatase [Maritalea mediterranea]